MMWILANHNKDKEEELEKLKTICMFISPQDAKKFFDASEDITTEVDNDTFIKELQSQSDQKFTSAELEERLKTSEDLEDLDIIERIGDD